MIEVDLRPGSTERGPELIYNGRVLYVGLLKEVAEMGGRSRVREIVEGFLYPEGETPSRTAVQNKLGAIFMSLLAQGKIRLPP